MVRRNTHVFNSQATIDDAGRIAIRLAGTIAAAGGSLDLCASPAQPEAAPTELARDPTALPRAQAGGGWRGARTLAGRAGLP